jgi:hypothetical protein
MPDVRIFRKASVDSDHYLVGFKIRAKIARSKLQTGVEMDGFNVALLKNGSTAKQYAERVTEILG